MTHSSDLTYLTRAVFVSWTFIWFLQHVWNIDRFDALRWKRVKKYELKASRVAISRDNISLNQLQKSVITILLVIMCPLQAFYDITISNVKYHEGFWVNPLNGEIISKPHQFWSKSNDDLVVPTNYILCANFSLQTCLLFLLQSFWNYLANNLAKTSFMGSFEFKSYIVYSIFSALIFPLLQFIYRDDTFYTEIIPQLVYAIFMFLIAMLGIRSHSRFTNLLHVTKNAKTPHVNIVLKLEYFRDMNRYLTWGLLIGSAAFMILCIDGLTSSKYLISHKFASDLILCHVNFSLWIVYITLILIFYPSTSTLSDALTIAKVTNSSSANTKGTLSNNLMPPNPQWMRSLNVDDSQSQSQWSTQISSQQTNSQMDSNSYLVEIHEDLPPPMQPYHERGLNSTTLPLSPPLSPPYHPSVPSIPPNSPPPPPPLPQHQIIIPPSTALNPITQSPTSYVKQSKLKYPSSPLLPRNNSFDNVKSVYDNEHTSHLPHSPPVHSPLNRSHFINDSIISPIPRKISDGSLLDYSMRPTPPKKSPRRPSVTSINSATIIRGTTSTTSLSSSATVNSVTLPSSDDETINKVTNLDTRKVAPFMYQDLPTQQDSRERSIPSIARSPSQNPTITKAGETFQKRREESRRQQQKSISQKSIPTEVSSQQKSSLGTTKTSQARVFSPSLVKFATTANENSNPPSSTQRVSKSSQPSRTSKTLSQVTTRSYHGSPLVPRSGGDNETASSSTSTIKKSFPMQPNNLENIAVRSRSGGVKGVVGDVTNSARNSVVKNNAIKSRSNSNTASIGNGKVNSTNSVRSSLLGSRTRSNSIADVGANSVFERLRSETISSSGKAKAKTKTIGRNRSVSSSSNSSTSSTGSIRKIIKAGMVI
ncbi:4413_t:CDS:2 [Funneliformis caledonium]|uniref:4413_t:CDS:1 n=1 Tax=Funneliformis caledonium TaxID=1117310 RepID=A0A9N9AQ12_9GLOM|nr:4413_t:CDS:2 [Funneliformis caledonium]